MDVVFDTSSRAVASRSGQASKGADGKAAREAFVYEWLQTAPDAQGWYWIWDGSEATLGVWGNNGASKTRAGFNAGNLTVIGRLFNLTSNSVNFKLLAKGGAGGGGQLGGNGRSGGQGLQTNQNHEAYRQSEEHMRMPYEPKNGRSGGRGGNGGAGSRGGNGGVICAGLIPVQDPKFGSMTLVVSQDSVAGGAGGPGGPGGSGGGGGLEGHYPLIEHRGWPFDDKVVCVNGSSGLGGAHGTLARRALLVALGCTSQFNPRTTRVPSQLSDTHYKRSWSRRDCGMSMTWFSPPKYISQPKLSR